MYRQNKIKLLVLGALLGAVLFLTACAGFQKMQITTSMEMDKHFKGQRVMTTVLPESLFNRFFDGDIDALQDMVTQYCPSTMLCTAEETSAGIQITMTLAFANYGDYQNKIGQILGRTPGIYFDYSDSMFKNGFMLQEDFTSLELYPWLSDALSEKYSQLKDKSLTDIFTPGTSQVVFDGGDAITADNPIQVEQMESHAFDSISAVITMHDDAYEAEINFFVDNDTYYTMGDKMDAAMKKLAPAGATYNVSGANDQRIYTFGFNAYNEKSLREQLNTVLKTENCEFEITDTGDDSETLKARKELTLYLDASYFLDFSKPDTTMTYHIKADSKYSFDTCESLTGFLKDYTSKKEGDSSSAYIVVGPSDKVKLGLSYSIDIKHIQIETTVSGENALERNLIFELDNEKAGLVGESFASRIQGRLVEGMSFETEEREGRTRYKVHMTAKSPEELSSLTTGFLDGDANKEVLSSTITGGRIKKHQLKSILYAYEDTVNLETFLSGAATEEGITYTITYPSNYKAALTEGTFSNTLVEKNVLTCTTLNPTLTVKTEGSALNLVGITQLILWWASFIFLIISLILNSRHIVGLWKNKEKYLSKVDIFTKKNVTVMSVGIISVVLFIMTTLRLLFKIY